MGIHIGDRARGSATAAWDPTRLDLEVVDRVCHELRRPLGAIDAYAELLADEIPGELNREQKDYVQVVRTQVRELADQVGSLYETFEALSGRLRPELADEDLESLLYELGQEFEEKLEPTNTRLSIRTPHPVLLHTDGRRLRSVLRRVLDNALKFGAEGGEIEVELEQESDRVRISVSDQGLGVPEEQLERVFECFYRAERSALASVKGLGLGLSYARAVVEALGGTMWMERGSLRGTVVVVELPLRPPRAAEEDIPWGTAI